MVQSIEKEPGFEHVQKKKKSLIISKLTISFFFLLYFNLCYLMKDFGLFFFFFLCMYKGKGGVVTSIPTIPSRVLYYPWHDYCVVLTLALGIISFLYFCV